MPKISVIMPVYNNEKYYTTILLSFKAYNFIISSDLSVEPSSIQINSKLEKLCFSMLSILAAKYFSYFKEMDLKQQHEIILVNYRKISADKKHSDFYYWMTAILQYVVLFFESIALFLA